MCVKMSERTKSPAPRNTDSVYRSNINFVAAEKYITRLLLRGMLVTVVDEGKSKFQTTTLGIEALSKLTEVQKLVEGT